MEGSKGQGWKAADAESCRCRELLRHVIKNTLLEAVTQEDIAGVLQRIWFCLKSGNVWWEFHKIFSGWKKNPNVFSLTAQRKITFNNTFIQTGAFYMQRKNLSWELLMSQCGSKDCKLEIGGSGLLLQKNTKLAKNQTEIHLQVKQSSKSQVPLCIFNAYRS